MSGPTSTGTVDLAVQNGRVLLPDVGLTPVDIWCSDGRITSLVPHGTTTDAARTIDAAGKVVLPGAIDAHIHLGATITIPTSPGEVQTETASAAAGGVTTVLAYLMTAEPYEDLFDETIDLFTKGSHVDFGLHFCIGTQHQLEQLPNYVKDLGVPSFKFFMNFRGEEGKYLGLPGNDDGFLYELLKSTARIGAMVNPHGENIEIVWKTKAAAQGNPDPHPLVAWGKSRPPIAEAEAEQRVAYMGRNVGASVFAVHVSSKMALDVLLEQRAHHPGVFIETCPHYLVLDETVDCGSYGKVNPPLRTADDAEALWAAIANGDVDVVGSDHVPRHRTAKEKDIWSASAGFPGMESLLPLLLSEGHVKRRIPLSTVVATVTSRPAQLFGLYPRKGVIAPGSDADLAIIDFGASYQLAGADLHSAAEYTPYEGTEVRCQVVETVLGGQTVFRAGELVGDPHGRYLRRTTSGLAALKEVSDAFDSVVPDDH